MAQFIRVPLKIQATLNLQLSAKFETERKHFSVILNPVVIVVGECPEK